MTMLQNVVKYSILTKLVLFPRVLLFTEDRVTRFQNERTLVFYPFYYYQCRIVKKDT